MKRNDRIEKNPYWNKRDLKNRIEELERIRSEALVIQRPMI
ncbi:MAG: hypothetical protein R6W99_00655 [Clostridia bacterium]